MVSTDTYEVTRTVNAGEAVIFPNTNDLTGRIHTLQIDTNGDCQTLIEKSEDSGVTFEEVADDYQVDNTKDKRSIFSDGIIRVTCTSNESSASQSITLTISSTSIDTLWITPEDVWRTAGLTADVLARGDVAWFIKRAISKVRLITGREYEATQITEKYVGDGSNILILDNYPVITLDTLTIDGTSVTPANVDIWLDTGKLILTDDAEETKFKIEGDGSRTTSVTYTYGTSDVPEDVKRLTECIAAVMMLTNQTGGTYDDVTRYNLGGVEASTGEPYMNIKTTVQNLIVEIKELMQHIRKQPFMA